MRVRLMIPLPGPFAVTSGSRGPRSTARMKGGSRGWLFWPSMPVQPHPLMAWFWCCVFILAVVWNVLVIVAWLLLIPVAAFMSWRAGRRVAKPTVAT